MGLRAKNGKWEYRFMVDGQRVQAATGLPASLANRRQAAQIEARHRSSIVEQWAASPWSPKSLNPIRFAQALPAFLDFTTLEYAPKVRTAARIKTSMASAVERFGSMWVASIGPGEVNAYKLWRLSPSSDRHAAPVTVKHDLDNLSVFFRWAITQGYARANPVRQVRKPSEGDSIRQHVLTHAEERAYLQTSLRRFRVPCDLAHEHGPYPDLHDLATLMLRQGLRPEEALKLRKQDLDLATGTLLIRAGKTKAARRRLGLTSEVRLILGLRMAGDSEWLFPSRHRTGKPLEKLNGAHALVCQASGVKFVLYDLRHTFATRLAEAGVDAFTIAAILGHASTRVLSRYIHPTQEHQLNAMRIYEARLPKLLEGRA